MIGATGGIGAAVTAALDAAGFKVTGLSRSEGLDFSEPEQAALLLAELSGPFDLIFVATGILAAGLSGPEKTVRALEAAEMQAQFAVNTIGPALVLREAPRLLPRQGRSVIATLSARVGSIGDNRLGGWYSYRSSKAALNQIVHTAAIELARTHKEAICVALHPGTVASRFTENYPVADKLSPELSAQKLLSVIEALGQQDSGGFFDWRGDRVPW